MEEHEQAEVLEETDQPEDAEDTRVVHEDAEDIEDMTGPFLGGLVIFYLPPSFRTHVVTAIWHGHVFLIECSDLIICFMY